jgi:superfamily II DNA or RNA helicase
VEALFAAVREAASSSTWSRGVELARAGAVVPQPAEADELAVRVATRGGLISPRVTLYPDDADWECECPSPDSVCEHTAAAVIALRRARTEGRELADADTAPGRIAYRLSREPGGLAIERRVVQDGQERPLETTLAAVALGRVDGPRFVASPEDLAVEQALGSQLRGIIARERMARILAALAGSPDLELDGEPVRASAEPLLPVARLSDRGDGFVLSLGPDPDIRATFANGAALCGDALRPLGDPHLDARERDELPAGRYYAPDRVLELVTEVLPSLQRRLHVEIETQRLPKTAWERPRLRVRVYRDGDDLAVLPTLVYGDPPRARIDAGRLVHLEGTVPVRDAKAEERLVQALRRELALTPGHRVTLAGAEAVELAERLRTWDGDVEGDAHAQFFLAAPLVPRLTLDSERFELRFESGSDGRRADPSAVLGGWREGASLVPLLGGGFAPLPADWLERHGHHVADLLAARQSDGGLPKALLPDLARLCEALDQPPPADYARLAALARGFESLPTAALPDDLRATLRPYQRQGVDWLVLLRDAGLGALLADDMGLGKTLQALCAVRGRTLVVVPTSVLENWRDEAARFRPSLRCAVYHGPRRELDPDADLTLTTYAILRLDADALAAVRWDAVFLDEAQAIKNPASLVARAAYRLQAEFRLTLTGTPVENRLEELWSQLHFTNPGLLGGRSDFTRRYSRPIADGDAAAATRLQQRIQPFVLRRLKRIVAADLPPRTEMVLRCDLDEAERASYDAIRAAARRDVVSRLQAGGSALAALEALLRLRQAACHRALVPGQTADRSSKLDLLVETLEEAVAEGHKALVFSQWTSLLDLVEPQLARVDLEFLRLDGSTRDRAGVVAAFQDDAGPPILLISLRAGGTGLNLTAADHVLLLDPWWNPAVEAQAADRAHRIGQTQPVLIHRLVARDTVEERILELQERKRALADAALAGAEGGSPLTRGDLLALLD